ncbi:uncharacterized protein LOC119066298 isoform X1 [Bradysia coprophila]|uniref:uncharacterized protein LOC119066298 isoform X1 n=1 Tax=Bradysia coprophila TaxID=38358 RepID=UPI00187DA7BD|nr:uncharacterized protein LOC119066298 isoform X1 [Bradysia coprophila]
MWLPRVVDLRFPILWLLIAADISLGLRDVRVTVPTAVKKGDDAHLICNYDLEGDALYSVKWYKGRREFYRYTPKENPAMKIFPLPGISVERLHSNGSHVLLTTVEPSISGRFSCEVSADSPSFHTMIVSGEMEIVELPEQKPTITGIHSRYRQGDTLQGNCTSHYSKPAANLTWTINDVPAKLSMIKHYAPMKDTTTNLELSVQEVNFLVTYLHFNNSQGRLKLKCTSRIHTIYETSVEKSIEEDRPKILASGTSGHNMNLYGPYDQPPQDNEQMMDQNNLHLTHYKTDMASSSSPLLLAKSFSSTALFFSTLVLSIGLLFAFKVDIS